MNWTTVKLKTAQKVEFKREAQEKKNRLIVFKENSDEFVDFAYEDIEFMCFKNLYLQKLAP